MTRYTPPMTFPTIDLSLAASPAHRVPLMQIADNLRGRPIELVALGSITSSVSKPRPVAFAITDDALLVGEQLPLGIDGYEERPRQPMPFLRFDDGTTAFVITSVKGTPMLYDFDDEAARAVIQALSPDDLGTFLATPRLSRADREAQAQDDFRASVRSGRKKILLATVIALAVIFFIGSLMNYTG